MRSSLSCADTCMSFGRRAEELRMRHLSVARLVLLWLHGAAVEATG